MLYQHVGLTLITLAPMPFVALATWIYSRRNEARYRAASEASSSLNSMLHDNIAGIRQIKAYTVEPQELLRFDRTSTKVQQAQLTQQIGGPQSLHRGQQLGDAQAKLCPFAH